MMSVTAKLGKQGRDDSIKQSVCNPTLHNIIFSYNACIMKNVCREVVYRTVLFYDPYFVALFFVILLSLHLVYMLSLLMLSYVIF